MQINILDNSDSAGNNYVYLLLCSDNSLYCGWTNNLEKRVNDHNGINGSKCGAKYTRCRRPVKLIYHETYETKSEALKRENEIKKMSRNEKESLIGIKL